MVNAPETSATAADLDSTMSQEVLHARGNVDCAEKLVSLKKFSEQRAARAQRSALIKIIEGEIIPKLFMAHRDLAPQRLAGIAAGIPKDFADYEFLAGMFLRGDTTEIVDRLQDILASGVRREQVYLEFIAPVPQALSLLWSEGRCSFDEMAKGLCCVDMVLHEMHEREHSQKD
jgi:hypothetical protein